MATESEPDIEQVTIADDGDVILVAGCDISIINQQRTAIRVPSRALSNVSPVFKALFGPHFREGQQPRSIGNPLKIKLPDDESLPMLQLCRLAHHQCENPSVDCLVGHPAITAAGLGNLATVLDKYGCVEPSKLQFAALLLSWLER